MLPGHHCGNLRLGKIQPLSPRISAQESQTQNPSMRHQPLYLLATLTPWAVEKIQSDDMSAYLTGTWHTVGITS